MARRGLTLEQRLERAIAGGCRMALGGDRPTFHLRRVDEGHRIVELEQLVAEPDQRRALEAARTAIAELLDVPPTTFDVEIQRQL